MSAASSLLMSAATTLPSPSLPSSPSSSQPSSSPRPIPLSSLVNRGRLPDDVVEACRENGVDCDLQLRHKQPEVLIERIKNIDVQREINKVREKEYWPDYDHFIDQFPCLNDLEPHHRSKAASLLYSFRHTFFNPDYPEQFRPGIRMTPVKIDRVAGMTPRKEKIRQINKKKETHLRNHISSLLSRGVIVETESVVDCYASNVHIVIESRYVASKKAVVEKSRATADCREINKCLPDSSFTLPNMEQFRRECTADGAKVFSNFDAVEMYHQIMINEESAAKNFNIHALGKIYTFLRGLQGVKLLPSICANLTTVVFESVDHTHPFLDDFTVRSADVDTHLDEHLPQTLALCSFYRILLSPKKTDLLRPSARVLGHQIAEESLSICDEKKKKILELSPPRDAKDLKSKLAFFQYFYQVAPRLNAILAPFRHFAKKGSHFKLTDKLLKAWDPDAIE